MATDRKDLDKYLITGAAGQLGYELQRQWGGEEGHAFPRPHEAFDIGDWEQVSQWLPEIRPDAVVNCASMTDMLAAESDREQAWRTHVLGVEHLCRICTEYDIPLFHVSSNYVFGQDTQRERLPRLLDGALGDEERTEELREQYLYREGDAPGPVNHFGATKLAAEVVILRHALAHPNFRWWIIRTGLVFERPWRHAHNFLYQLAHALLSGHTYDVPTDAWTNWAYAPHLAEAIRWMVEKRNAIDPDVGVLVEGGIYHLANCGEASWYDVAQQVAVKLGASDRITRATRSEHARRKGVNPALCPGFTCMSLEKWHCALGPAMPSWQDAVAEWITAARGHFKRAGLAQYAGVD